MYINKYSSKGEIRIFDIFAVCSIVLTICLLAAILPARRAMQQSTIVKKRLEYFSTQVSFWNLPFSHFKPIGFSGNIHDGK
ncbi:MAG: hypothetical protein IPL95_07895 [Saprospiraceae bacterium]|nr:hypothetical protein [Saprospiraceae bacterium]